MESGDQKTEVELVGQRPPVELKAWRTLVETKGWRAKVKLKSRKFMAGPDESTDHDGARRIRRSQRSVVCARSGSISQLTRSARTGTDSGMKSVAESVIFRSFSTFPTVMGIRLAVMPAVNSQKVPGGRSMVSIDCNGSFNPALYNEMRPLSG